MNLIPLSLLLQRLRQHQIPHPINPLIPRLDRKMMRLCRRRTQNPLLLCRRHKLESESTGGIGVLFLPAQLERLEGGVDFRRVERRAGDGVVVDVDALEGVHGVLVLVHGETGTVEAEVVLVPFVAEHFGLSLLHPAGVVDVACCWG